MKKTKKIVVALLMLTLIVGSLTFVNAGTGFFSEDRALDNVTISDGVKAGNKVTFDINLPAETKMRGDVTSDVGGCVVDNKDSANILEYVVMNITADEIDLLKADFDGDGRVNVADVVRINMAVLGIADVTDEQLKEAEELGYIKDADRESLEKIVVQRPVILKGTLASESTAKIIESSEGKYKIEVTLPSENAEGTIGVSLVPGVFISNERDANNSRKFSGFVTSKLLNNSTGVSAPLPVNTVTISDGEKNDTKVTFKINIGENTVLRGDANSDGKVDTDDVILVQKKITNQSVEINETAADANGDGEINGFDTTIIKDIANNNSDTNKANDTVTLTGDLKDKASAKLVKDANGNFAIEVTIPNTVAEGKIGVTLAEGAFINAEKAKSGKVSSKEFSYTNPNAVKDDVKDETPAKDDVKDETPAAKDDGKDDTTSNTKIPQTGVTNVMLVVIAGVAIVGTVVFIRSRKMLK